MDVVDEAVCLFEPDHCCHPAADEGDDTRLAFDGNGHEHRVGSGSEQAEQPLRNCGSSFRVHDRAATQQHRVTEMSGSSTAMSSAMSPPAQAAMNRSASAVCGRLDVAGRGVGGVGADRARGLGSRAGGTPPAVRPTISAIAVEREAEDVVEHEGGALARA